MNNNNNRFAEALENINIGYNDFGAYLQYFYRDLGRDNIEGAIRQAEAMRNILEYMSKSMDGIYVDLYIEQSDRYKL